MAGRCTGINRRKDVGSSECRRPIAIAARIAWPGGAAGLRKEGDERTEADRRGRRPAAGQGDRRGALCRGECRWEVLRGHPSVPPSRRRPGGWQHRCERLPRLPLARLAYGVTTRRMVRGPRGIFVNVPGLDFGYRLFTRVLPLGRAAVTERGGELYLAGRQQRHDPTSCRQLTKPRATLPGGPRRREVRTRPRPPNRRYRNRRDRTSRSVSPRISGRCFVTRICGL